jgi:curved DNA-binding protein CbpA
MEENYYDLLNISCEASPEMVDEAYRNIVKRLNPDRYHVKQVKQKQHIDAYTRKIEMAYQTIRNPNKRQHYNNQLQHHQKKQNLTRLSHFPKWLKRITSFVLGAAIMIATIKIPQLLESNHPVISIGVGISVIIIFSIFYLRKSFAK